MDPYTATELAYKNGYRKAVDDSIAIIQKLAGELPTGELRFVFSVLVDKLEVAKNDLR